jgi:PPOX class probable F420-dependent enzyme
MASDPQRVDPQSIDTDLLALAASRNVGALATIKRDGRPQLSNVNFTLDPGAEGGPLVRASVVDGLAKVANLRRDPRASLMVTTPDGWS